MPGTISDGPSVTMSFANNFWGLDNHDEGVERLISRMLHAKQTNDELKSFYNTRAAIEDEYARKLMSLSRKPLGSQEAGTLRASLDVMRGEVEAMGKSHQQVAQQMKSELEEPLAAFAGGMKERRKIIQTGVEKLLKTKIQQTQQVNKTRDKYEQECLKIKGYLAQGHMVMGQEERKNKAKLEKTQINLATSNTEYENAVKILEETTGRWNRDWKAAADKFQDLEEERLDFTKSSLWTFANIASTVCVSDDGSCEKIRLSLENCEVEKDIITFIRDQGTGQEIPDPPKYINFCRGDLDDSSSEVSEAESYSVAQFQRTINPAFRSSSPQPSTYESHHDPTSDLAKSLGHKESNGRESREATITPQKALGDRSRTQKLQYDEAQHGPLASVPHNPYPMDGMTMLCKPEPLMDRNSQSPMRPSSIDSQSDYSNSVSFASSDPPSGQQSPIKQPIPLAASPEKTLQKKKSSNFFQSHSPFRRKSRSERESPLTPAQRNTWAGRSGPNGSNSSFRPQAYQQDSQGSLERRNSEEPVDPRASFQLNVGNNVFDVATPGKKNSPIKTEEELHPLAQTLAELNKQSSVRMSADAHYGMATPAPGTAARSLANASLVAGVRGTPPPSYDQPPMQRLGAPQPAHTAKAMQQTRQRYVDQAQNVFGQGRPTSRGYSSPQSRPSTRGNEVPRATSPAPPRSASPRPGMQPQNFNRSVSPNPYGSVQGRQRAQSMAPGSRGSDNGSFRGSPGNINRAVSPAPLREYERPGSSQVARPGSSQVMNGDMSMQLSMGGGSGDEYGSARGRRGSVAQHSSNGRSGSARPVSYYAGQGQTMAVGRQRSKSVADGRQFNRDGKPILHFAKAMYTYQAAIPEELSFAKNDILAVLRLQDDGWWEAEVAGQNGRPGLVPSNYLQNCSA